MKGSTPSSEHVRSENTVFDLLACAMMNSESTAAEAISVGDGVVETEDSVTVGRENVERISSASSASARAKCDELDNQEAMPYS